MKKSLPIFVSALAFLASPVVAQNQVIEPSKDFNIILNHTLQFVKTKRNFDFKNAPISEVSGYIDLAARENWNRLIDAGVVKNKTFRSWSVKHIESDARLSYAAKDVTISEALEALCSQTKNIAIFDETGLIIVPDTIIIDQKCYKQIVKRVYVKSCKI
jgi:hypothetical protein